MRIVRALAVSSLSLALALGLGSLPAPLGGPRPALAATTLKAQFFLPKGHPLSKHLEEIYGKIAQATGGEVTVRGFYASELVPLPQALEGTSKGTLDLLVGPGNYYSGKIAIADFSIMPRNFRRYTDRTKAFYDGGLGAIVDKVYNKIGITIPAPYTYFTGEVVLVRKGLKANSYGDLKGLKLRVAGGELVEMVKAMGAQPVFIAPPEMYTGLQRGTVDGAIFPDNDLVLLKLHEVIGTVIGPDYLFSGPMMHFFMFNQASWNKLPAAARSEIEGVLRAQAAEDDGNAEAQLVTPWREKGKAAGVKYIDLSAADIQAARAATDAAREAYLRFNREQGHGAEAEQVLAILDRLSGL